MGNNQPARVACGPGMLRRDVLRMSLAVALPATLSGFAKPALAAITSSSYVLPVRKRGSTVVNVRNFGAAGDGVNDDTAAIQAAINALPSSGGTVDVPAGTYLIDALASIRLRSYMHLRMAPDARLVAKPNGSARYTILYARKLTEVEISGGQVVGERDSHVGTTGEWGHGVFVHGSSNVTVRDLHVSRCWGDGLVIAAALAWQAPSIPSTNVVVANVVSTGSRRQALTIGHVNDVKLYDCEFSYSNGCAPQCGIDIEPENGDTAYKVLFQNCLVRGNARYGMLLWSGAQGVTIRDCTIEHNSCGIVTWNAVATYVAGCTIRNNSATGVFIQDGTRNCQVSRNTFYGNYSRFGTLTRDAFSMTGWSPEIERDILIQGTTYDVRITTNYYR